MFLMHMMAAGLCLVVFGGVIHASGASMELFTYEIENSSLNWTEARQHCLDKGGDLASIVSAEDQSKIKAMVVSYGNYWIGLNDRVKEGTFNWSDGSAVNFTRWRTGEPNDDGKNEDCGQIVYGHENENDRTWNDDICSRAWKSICKIPVASFRYEIKHSLLNWTQARQSCMDVGGDLASILSAEDQLKIETMIVNHGDYWIGLNDRVKEGTFVWSDGSAINFTKWMPGEPNDQERSEDCGQIIYLIGENVNKTWNDNVCSRKMKSICKIPAHSSMQLDPTSVMSTRNLDLPMTSALATTMQPTNAKMSSKSAMSTFPKTVPQPTSKTSENLPASHVWSVQPLAPQLVFFSNIDLADKRLIGYTWKTVNVGSLKACFEECTKMKPVHCLSLNYKKVKNGHSSTHACELNTKKKACDDTKSFVNNKNYVYYEVDE